jgi:hypothetical protein
MKKSFLSIAASLVFLAAVSFAQTAGDQSQGTQGSSPSSQQDPSMSQGTTSGQDTASGQTAGQGSMKSDSGMKGEKKMKGCVRSEGGQYMLEEKGGKTVALTGQDLSGHVGHEVTVHGMWGSGSSSDSSSMSSGSSSGSAGMAKTFNVTSVDMVSSTCSMGKSKSSSDTMQK